MTTKRKNNIGKRPLSLAMILQALIEGRYVVDLETGTIYGRLRGGKLKAMATYPCGRRGEYRSVRIKIRIGRLFYRRNIMVHRVVWMAGHQRVIPRGRQIDHVDDNTTNNRFTNLRLLTHKQNMAKRDAQLEQDHADFW